MTERDTESVAESWRRIEDWLAAHLPEVRDALHPGATDAALDALEAVIGQPLPADVRASLRLHNGQRDRNAAGNVVTGVVFGLPLLPLAETEDAWLGWQDTLREYGDDPLMNDPSASHPPGAIQLRYIVSGWIPLTHDSGGNHFGVDLDPGPDGTRGQVITFGPDDDEKYVVAPSWGRLLRYVADELEGDNFAIETDDEDGTRSLHMGEPPNSHFHEAVHALHEARGAVILDS